MTSQIVTARRVGAALALLALACACREPRPSADGRADPPAEAAAPVPEDALPGQAAPGMKWVREERLAFCERPANPAEQQSIARPDSAQAVAAARRMLAPRIAETPVSMVVRTPDGILVHFAPRERNVLDGTATVYVTPGPCVTWLGW
jgi:hypothetical protein